MVPGLGFLSAIVVAMIYGLLHGGVNLFFDWRALALGIGLYCVFAMWLRRPEDAHSAVSLFAGYMGLRVAFIYAAFFRGGGDEIVGVRIPVFDGPTLSAIVFTAVLAVLMSDATGDRWQKLMWMSLGAASYMLVLLCFRRTFWAELGIATALLLLIQKRRRGRKLMRAMVALAVVSAILGPAFYARLQSLDITTHESEFSQDNADHVGEVLDAWEQVQQHPVMGIGLGRSFQTLRIQDWKEESVMVHNAPLHVWLKYGLLGLAGYVWFHFALFGWLYRQQREMEFSLEAQDPSRGTFGAKAPRLLLARDGTAEAAPLHQDNSEAGRIVDGPSLRASEAWLGAALVYLAAQFVVSMGFTPWPYSSVQSATLIAFVLAVTMTGTTS